MHLYDIHIRNYFAGRMNRVKGQTDLVYQNGKFYLYTICDMLEDIPLKTDYFLGVDLGETNIAVDSTGKIFSNDKIRLKYQKQKKPLLKEKYEIK
jgi:transposase